MEDGGLTECKKNMRAYAKTVRAEVAQFQNEKAARSFASHGVAFTHVLPPAVVSGYMPFGDEADIRLLMHSLVEAGYQLALPVIIKKAAPLEFRAWAPGADLEAAQWGIMEPSETAEVLLPDVVLSPLLAFDDEGYRLGYGGGFYDRSLEKLRALKPVVLVGIAFDEQRVDSVPRDAFDQRLDWIMTPSGVRQFT